MSAVCYSLAGTGTATELDTELSTDLPTLHIGLQQVPTALDVVGSIGEDAEESDTSM